ncbi:MAG: PLP-dependent aminotransferase family protein [Bacteroidota bacterium]
MSKSPPELTLPFIRLDKAGSVPMYHQLYESIKRSILEGMLKQGERMPSTRVMAGDLSVSRNCVLLAFEQLILEGYLHGKAGSGTYVCELPELPKRNTVPVKKYIRQAAPVTKDYPLSREILIRDSQLEPMKPFQTSVPSLEHFPFATWAKLASNVYRNIRTIHLGYDDAQGYLPLRKVLADYLRIHRSIHCSPDQIVIVNGSRQALHLAIQLLVSKGDLCWTEDPGYHGAKVAITQYGGKICPVPVTHQGMDVAYAIQHFPLAKLAYVTPSNQYPMGGTLPLPERLKLLKWAAKQKMWIIEDDYDNEFRYHGRPIPALQSLDRDGTVIYVGTFSKVLFPALRIGYLVVPSVAMAEQFKFAKSITDRQNPVIDQAILSEFIAAGHFSRHLRRMRVLYKQRHDELLMLMDRHLKPYLDVTGVEAGMHIVASLKQRRNMNIIIKKALEAGVILHNIDDFAMQFKQHNSLMLGFTGFTVPQMTRAVATLQKIMAQ